MHGSLTSWVCFGFFASSRNISSFLLLLAISQECHYNILEALLTLTLHEKCPNTEFFLVRFFRGKIRTRRNFVFGHFSRSVKKKTLTLEPWLVFTKRSDLRQFLATEIPLKLMKNAFFLPSKLFSFSRLLIFILIFWSYRKRAWLER